MHSNNLVLNIKSKIPEESEYKGNTINKVWKNHDNFLLTGNKKKRNKQTNKDQRQ